MAVFQSVGISETHPQLTSDVRGSETIEVIA